MFMRNLCARYSPSITKMLGPQVISWLLIPSDSVAAIRTSFTKLQTLVRWPGNLHNQSCFQLCLVPRCFIDPGRHEDGRSDEWGYNEDTLGI